MNYVIIGNGAAGIAAAEKLRKLDSKCNITILSAESYSAYSKCLLADYISGQMLEEKMYYRDKNFYERKGIQIYYNHKVVNIDFKAKIITTESPSSFCENGSMFGYDRLLIASGSTPILPKIRGMKETNAYHLGTFDDAKKILADSKKARKIIVIGGGYVGLEAAFNLYKNGKEVTIIECFSRLLQNQLDEKASVIIQNAVQEEGIRLILNAKVVEVSKPVFSGIAKVFTGNSSDVVVLDDGRRLKADMIIMAAGSKPNLSFINEKNLTIKKGILVDKYMQTSVRDIYAAGDVVESIDAVTGTGTLSPIWPNAVIQGEYAAYNMAGLQKEFTDLVSSQNASEFREIPMIAMGVMELQGHEVEEYIDYRPIEKIYRKVLIKDDIIVGMVFLGDIKNAGVIGALMKKRANVNKIKNNLLNANFGFSEVASLI